MLEAIGAMAVAVSAAGVFMWAVYLTCSVSDLRDNMRRQQEFRRTDNDRLIKLETNRSNKR